MQGIWRFLGGLALVIGGSIAMAPGVDRLGARLRLSTPLLGLVTALAADAPEISSAVTAMVTGARDIGLGVVLGSNLYNLAALLGLSALIAGEVEVHRCRALFSSAVSLLLTTVAACLILGFLGPIAALTLTSVLFILYVLLLCLKPEQTASFRLPEWGRDVLAGWLRAIHPDDEKPPDIEPQRQSGGSWVDILLTSGALGGVVMGSIWMVSGAVALARTWSIPHGLLGTLILAALTGLPNTYTAVRLARAGQGGAVVSEALNSNTINLAAGVMLPALVFGISRASGAVVLDLVWLLGLTLATLILLARGHLRRAGGALMVLLYLIFVAGRVLLR